MTQNEAQSDLTRLAPPTELTSSERNAFFRHFMSRLAAHRNHVEMYARNEQLLAAGSDRIAQHVQVEINRWAQVLLENAWAACQEPGEGESAPELHIIAFKLTFYLSR
jgi:hypothetical protein